MKFHKTDLEGVWIIDLEPFEDERGYFARAFCANEFAKQGLNFQIVQSNRSMSRDKGVIRGLHFQLPPKAEDKLVQCTNGAFYQVVVDLRPDSPTRGKWISTELSEANKRMILIPKGCAAGTQTLQPNSALLYFMSEFYSPAQASGLRYDDPAFGVTWPILPPALVSDKDKQWPLIETVGWPKF